LNILQLLDEKLFYYINVTLANPVTDKFFSFITVEDRWFVFYAIIWLYLMIAGGRRGRVAALLALLLVLISDQASSNLIKNLVQRVRPCNALPNVHLLVGCTGSYSFPSSHAVNNFAGAYFFSYFYPKMKYALYTGAFLSAISRVFCGVHYPFDVLGGIIIGLFIGWLVIEFWKALNKKLKILT
jgi:undecaprenyl-diphosphatase